MAQDLFVNTVIRWLAAFQMASWNNNGWIDRSRGWDDRSRGWDGRSRGWTENAWQSWGHTNNEGGSQWEDWGDSQEENESIDQDESIDQNKTDAERQSMLYSPDPVTNELIPIESPIVPQSRRPPKPVRLVPQSPTSCTPVSQPLDSHLHEEMREAYQDNVEVPGTSSTNPTAVAENPTAVAVAVMEPPILAMDIPIGAFDLAYFQRFRPFTGGYKQHNIALKLFRNLAERRNLNFIVFDNHRCVNVAVCDHPKGMLFSFDETRTTEWNWKEMVAQMDAESMKRVVEGPNAAVAEGIKIAGCAIVKTDRHDQKRNFALKDRVTVFHIWDFVFFRSDGSQIGCHPNYKSTKFGSYEGWAQKDHELPKGGKGGSSGPGTYTYFKKKGIDHYLRFDATKRPQ